MDVDKGAGANNDGWFEVFRLRVADEFSREF